MFKRILVIAIIILLGTIMVVTVSDMPEFGSQNVPDYNQSAIHYIENSLSEVHSANLVTAIIIDYRAFDTLIETIVFFTASISVMIIAYKKDKSEWERGPGKQKADKINTGR